MERAIKIMIGGQMKKFTLFLSVVLSIAVLFFPAFAHAEKRINKPHRFNQIYNQILSNTEYLTLGNPFGKYVIVDFFDYRCPFCQRFHAEMIEALEAGKLKNVRWILIETPIFGDNVNFVARYMQASKQQGKYKEFFLAAANKGHLSLYNIEDIAKEVGLNLEQLKKDAYTKEISNTFRDNIRLYKKFKVQSVPLLIVDKKVYSGAILGEKLDDLLKDAND